MQNGEADEVRDGTGEEAVGRRTGETLAGRYQLGRVLGSGGFGVVYDAFDTSTSTPVAVKFLHGHLADVREAVSRFRREAAVVSAVTHPGVVAIHDSGTTGDGTMYLVMEKLEGQELSTLLDREGPLSVGRATRIAAQVADALAAVHGAGIVHRDLKPENVFMVASPDGDDWVKLLDFGVSKIVGEDRSKASIATRTGAALGTLYYMAPEQAQGLKDLDGRVDVYALGVIVFQMLTGELPFDAQSFPMLVVKICTEPPPPLAERRSDVPPALDALYRAMLAKDPSERVRTAVAVRDALAAYFGEDSAPQLRMGATARLSDPSLFAHAATMASHGEKAAERADDRSDDSGDGDGDESLEPNARSRGNGNRLVLLAAALGLLAYLGVAVATRERPAPRHPRATSLPTAHPPEYALLDTATADGAAWRWANPLPRAMPTWNDVDVGAAGLVAMAGRDGTAAYYARRSLYRVKTGTRTTLHAIAWTSATDSLVAGDEGTLVALTPNGPRRLETHVSLPLRDVAVVSPFESVVVGDRGTMLRVVAGVPASVDVGRTEDLLGVAARGDDVFAVGAEGVIVRLREGRLHDESWPSRTTLRGVGGCSDGPLYAVGDLGVVLRRSASGEWQRIATTSQEPYSDVACDGDRVVVSGMRGNVLVAKGDDLLELETGSDQPLFGASSTRGESPWVVGAGGRLLRVARDHVTVLTAGSAKNLYDAASLSGRVYAVGVDGTLLFHDGSRFVDGPHATDAGLAALAPLSAEELLAVGDSGAILRIRNDGAELVDSPTDDSLRDVVVADGIVLAVGTNGTLVHGVVGALVAEHVDGVGSLWAVDGVPERAFAVGEQGAILRIEGGAVRRVACDRSETLRGVRVREDGVRVVGARGLVLRLEASGCVVEHEGGDDLFAIGRGPDGRLLAVGRGGSALARGDDGSWSEVDLDVAGHDLHALVETDRELVLVGAGGLLLLADRPPR